uniref:MARVEL domain-containing protein n=1 Tax=Panagrellus redivivus TaxID=6233 RepID=A0A7E4W3X4_PANRE
MFEAKSSDGEYPHPFSNSIYPDLPPTGGMKQPSAPPLEFSPPPAYSVTATRADAYAPVGPPRRKFCCGLLDARKGAFILSITGICFSFLFLFILFLEGVVLLIVCIISAYAYYKKNPFLYIPHICFLLLNCVLLIALTAGAVVAIFAPELASAYIPYLPDIVKEWYRYFAIFCVLICLGITAFCLWITEIFYKAFRATRDINKQAKLVDHTTV